MRTEQENVEAFKTWYASHRPHDCWSAWQEATRQAEERVPAADSAVRLTDETFCDLQYAVTTLDAIADRQRQVNDVIEPIATIAAASRIAKEASRRLNRAVLALTHHDADKPALDAPTPGADQDKRDLQMAMTSLKNTQQIFSALRRVVGLLLEARSALGPEDHELRDRIVALLNAPAKKGGAA